MSVIQIVIKGVKDLTSDFLERQFRSNITQPRVCVFSGVCMEGRIRPFSEKFNFWKKLLKSPLFKHVANFEFIS